MSHYCARCGAESECRYSGWADRHPAAAVAGAIVAVAAIALLSTVLIAALAVYPLATLGFSVLTMAGGAGALTYRRDTRLKAAVRRFDYESGVR